MNNLDKAYTDLLQDIIDNGYTKEDRTGTGTLSVFGRQIRHKMSEGFPLLTTKKMHWKSIVTELLWFLRGDTNIKYLVDNDCHIWDGDAYKNYCTTLIGSITFSERGKHFKSNGLEFNSGYPNYVHYSQEEFIQQIKTDNEFANKWGELGPIYGKQWRKWGRKGKYMVNEGNLNFSNGTFIEIDQIANLISELKTNPDSRRLMVNAWNVGELDQMVLPPCHYGFQVYTRELSTEERRKLANYESEFVSPMTVESWDRNNIPTRAISLMWNQRSCDLFLGIPFNIASYGLLLEIIANEVNMIPDELIGNLGDVHLYNNHKEQAVEQIGRTPFELPTLDKLPDYLSKKDNWECYKPEDFIIENYQSHEAIKAPLSN
jgi:thymidylate synthase